LVGHSAAPVTTSLEDIPDSALAGPAQRDDYVRNWMKKTGLIK